MVDIIVYAYDFAPNPQKLFHFLAYFNIPYKYYKVSPTLPRPELASVGVQYRRTPLLSIDSDLYVDNALIIEKLRDIAAHSNPDVETSNHLEFDGLGQQIFRAAVSLIPTSSPILHDTHFLQDRMELIGNPRFTIESMETARPQNLTDMLSYLDIIERHFLLNGERRFVRGGDKPTTADIYLYWSTFAGLRAHEGARPEISKDSHAIVFEWLARIEAFLSPRRQVTPVSWEEAKAVLVAPPKHEYAKFVPHDERNPLNIQSGDKVTVTPVDTGKSHPQHGTVISLNTKQICLRNEKGLVMHFPRINYTVARV